MKKIALFIICALLFPQITFASPTTFVQLEPQGDDEYKLEFENRQAVRYKIPYITNENGVFKYGDDNDDLVFLEANFTEGRNATETASSSLGVNTGASEPFNIGLRDYFVVSDVRKNTTTAQSGDENEGFDNTAISSVLRYNSIDTSNRTLSFHDLATGTKEFTYESLASGSATYIGKTSLIFNGNTYVAYIANVTEKGGDNPLAVDMDGDGDLEGTEIRITINGGGILDLGSSVHSAGGNYTMNGNRSQTTYAQTWSNTGYMIRTSSNISLFTLLTQEGIISGFPLQNETVLTTIEIRNNNQIGIRDVVGSNFLLRVPPDVSTFFTTYGTDVILQGNATTQEAETLNITQALSLAPTLSLEGTPTIGNTINLTLSYRPHLGQHYYLMLSLAQTPPYTLADGRIIPLKNDSLMQSSLFTPDQIGLSNSQSILDLQGNGHVILNIPDVPGLAGYDIYAGFVTADITKPLPQAVQAISPATKITLLGKP